MPLSVSTVTSVVLPFFAILCLLLMYHVMLTSPPPPPTTTLGRHIMVVERGYGFWLETKLLMLSTEKNRKTPGALLLLLGRSYQIAASVFAVVERQGLDVALPLIAT